MIDKLPRWVWSGAWMLAFVAGMVNVVGLLGFKHQAITHLTGTTSWLAAAVAGPDRTAAFHLILALGSFVGGAALSGMLIQDNTLQLGHRYGFALLMESLLLCLAVPLLNRGRESGIYLASCACGLQNAMASTYSGATVRTTHLSGMFTDLGIYFGHFLRGIPVDQRRLRLCLFIIVGFFAGGLVGAGIFRRYGYSTLYFPALLTGLAAVGYGTFQWWQNRRGLTGPPGTGR